MSTKKKSNILEYFGIDNVQEEFYNIEIKKEWLVQLSRHSKATLNKLVTGDIFKAGVDEENKTYWYLPMEKRYSLTVKEQLDSSDTDSFLPLLFSLSQELIGLGHNENDVSSIIFTPEKWGVLTTEQVEKANLIVDKALKQQNQSVGLVTIVMQRICPNWQVKDTRSLSTEFFEELYKFASKEQQGWGVEEESGGELLNLATTTAVVS